MNHGQANSPNKRLAQTTSKTQLFFLGSVSPLGSFWPVRCTRCHSSSLAMRLWMSVLEPLQPRASAISWQVALRSRRSAERVSWYSAERRRCPLPWQQAQGMVLGLLISIVQFIILLPVPRRIACIAPTHGFHLAGIIPSRHNLESSGDGMLMDNTILRQLARRHTLNWLQKVFWVVWACYGHGFTLTAQGQSMTYYP